MSVIKDENRSSLNTSALSKVWYCDLPRVHPGRHPRTLEQRVRSQALPSPRRHRELRLLHLQLLQLLELELLRLQHRYRVQPCALQLLNLLQHNLSRFGSMSNRDLSLGGRHFMNFYVSPAYSRAGIT